MIKILAEFGALDFSTIYSVVSLDECTGLTVICLLLFLGAVGKSAQLGLHT